MIRNLGNHTLDYLMEGFQLISFDWRYLYVNETVIAQGKRTKDELIGHTMMECYPGIEQTELFRKMEHCMHNRIPEQFENKFVYEDHSFGWFDLHIQPVPEGIFVLSVDISARKQAEAQLLRMNELLEEKVALRTEQLQRKNQDMLDSLHYAKNIQKAFLPRRDDFLELFPEALLINQPKDIVSGDFYWYKEVGNRIILAATDCTGHGVPGALMSMIGIEKLNNIALKTTDPSEMLQRLNKSIKIALFNTTMYERCHDGMDIAICCIDRERRTIRYAGANRPIWVIRKGHAAIEITAATKKAIGGYTDDNQHFESHELQLQEGDTFYLFTDGYADTFSGHRKSKKLTTKRFRQILLEIREQPLQEQETALHHFLEEWKDGTEQIDDILVIGVRL